jgi:N-acetylglucosaminyldiphosphoundecaprenol N-acetyl-beta-D-mannosaminyltransferase
MAVDPMMNSEQGLTDLYRRGVRVQAAGGRVHVTLPEEAFDDGLGEALASCTPAIRRFLQRGSDRVAGHVTPWGRRSTDTGPVKPMQYASPSAAGLAGPVVQRAATVAAAMEGSATLSVPIPGVDAPVVVAPDSGDTSDRISVLGVPVDAVSMEKALEKAREIGRGSRGKAVLAVNAEKVIAARKDPLLQETLNKAGLLNPDGIGVVFASRLLYGKRFSRVAGADLCPELCRVASEEGWGVFLFGAREDVNRAAAEELQRRYPDLTIAGRQDGYVKPDDMPAVVERIRESRAVFLFLALGSPRQELWMAEHLDACGVKLCQGVGGTFDVLAGRVKRAPLIWRKYHLEWLYRLLAEPKRLLRQTALPMFAMLVLKEKLKRR